MGTPGHPGVHRVLEVVVPEPAVPSGFVQEQEPDRELREHQPAPRGWQEGHR